MKFTSTLAGSDPAAAARAELPAQAHTGKVASIMEREHWNKRYAEAVFIRQVQTAHGVQAAIDCQVRAKRLS